MSGPPHATAMYGSESDHLNLDVRMHSYQYVTKEKKGIPSTSVFEQIFLKILNEIIIEFYLCAELHFIHVSCTQKVWEL